MNSYLFNENMVVPQQNNSHPIQPDNNSIQVEQEKIKHEIKTPSINYLNNLA